MTPRTTHPNIDAPTAPLVAIYATTLLLANANKHLLTVAKSVDERTPESCRALGHLSIIAGNIRDAINEIGDIAGDIHTLRGLLAPGKN